MSKHTHFFFNGQEYCTQNPITLFDLIAYFNYNNSLSVIEYNNLICCNKKNLNNTYITNNDKIEIVTIVGGG